MTERGVPRALGWVRRLQAIAQSGLAYEHSLYDGERYEEVRRLAAEIAADGDEAAAGRLEAMFGRESGHATPKLDIRGVVFRGDGILLVKELSDAGRWTLPGGWADVGESPSEAVMREVREESGYATLAVKLLALYDRDRHGHPPHAWHTWKAIFLCELLSDDQGELGEETGGAEFFPPDGLPDLSVSRVTAAQIARFFEHRLHPEWPTDFD